MKKTELFQKLKDLFEEENLPINEQTNLQDLEGFDSLGLISLIAFIDKNFGKRFTTAEFYTAKTVRNLMELIGLENFE